MGNGIDYGNGITNIDHKTGIRFGVIPVNDVLQAWADSADTIYPVCEEHGDSCEEDCMDGAEPIGDVLDDGEYLAEADSIGDIFVMKSPYYTRAAFCSPCAPGACYLRDFRPDGEKAYCLGHDFFEEGKAPYTVFRVSDNSIVEP